MTRPAYAITCGGCTLLALLSKWNQASQTTNVVIRDFLAPLESARRDNVRVNQLPTGPTLAINARLTSSPAMLSRLETLAKSEQCSVIMRNGIVLAKWFPNGIPGDSSSDTTYDELLESVIGGDVDHEEECSAGELVTLEFPHDIARLQLDYMTDNLAFLVKHGGHREVADGVFAADGVTIAENVATDTRNGPIVLDEGATVRPFAFLRGPIVVGTGSRINEHSSIKDGVCIGHTVKVGGELERSTVEPYSNKAHAGFLGFSYLGGWVNLGAGTSNSNLKNTYGTIRVTRNGQKIDTGMQFLGCVIGDHAKSAINSSIFTGLTIGVASMLYGTIAANVPSFVNYAHSFGSVTGMTLESMVTTQGRVYARRGLEQLECDTGMLRHVFEATQHERVGLEFAPPRF